MSDLQSVQGREGARDRMDTAQREMNMNSVETSPLLQRIRAALDSLNLDGAVLRVSVADEPKWEKSLSGDEVLARWLCWSIEHSGKEVSAPEFEVVHQDITRQRLAAELPAVFSDIEVIVDSDIDA